jgi:hypothetical protein
MLATHRAPVAQWIEHLTTDQKVGGSSPFGRARDQGRDRRKRRSRPLFFPPNAASFHILGPWCPDGAPLSVCCFGWGSCRSVLTSGYACRPVWITAGWWRYDSPWLSTMARLPVDRRLLRWCRSGQPRTWRSCPPPVLCREPDPPRWSCQLLRTSHGDRGGHAPPRGGVLVTGPGRFRKERAHRPRRRARRGRDPRRRARPGPFRAAGERGDFPTHVAARCCSLARIAASMRSTAAVRTWPAPACHWGGGSVRCGCQYPAEPVTLALHLPF